MIKVGVVGCGQWGSNYIRIFHELEGCHIDFVCDVNEKRLRSLKRCYPDVSVETSWKKMTRHSPQTVVIATPATTHYLLAKRFLESGSHVLIEKPMATSMTEAQALVRLAEKKKRVLMVGHVFEYHPAVQKMKEEIQKGTLGRLFYLYSIRSNLGPIRHDVNAVWDLAPHDLSIFSYLTGSQPLVVIAEGDAYFKRGREDVAFITLRYPNRLLASIHVSWLAPRKRREITIVGSKQMLIFNDMKPEEPLRFYNQGVDREPSYRTFGDFKLLFREGDIRIPRVPPTEPLKNLCLRFLEAVQKGQGAPASASGGDGLRVIATLEAIQRSLRKKGMPIHVKGVR